MKYFILLLFIFIFFSCDEYEYKKPLTPICKAKIDTNATGIWIFDNIKKYNNFNIQLDTHFLIIYPFNKNEYAIIFNSTKQKSNNIPVIYKGHISKIGKYTFANVKWLNDESEYIYYAFKIENDSLYYWGFLKNKVPYQINAKRFFTKHYNDTNIISAIRVYKKFKHQIPLIPNVE